MRRTWMVGLAVGVVALGGLGVTRIASAAKPAAPGPPGPAVVSLDDAFKQALVVSGDINDISDFTGNEVNIGPLIEPGKRLVIETVSVNGDGYGPVTQDQATESVTIKGVTSEHTWEISVPLDRYSYPSADGQIRYWRYAGTEAVRAYADPDTQLTAVAFTPGPPTSEHLHVSILGYLVTLPTSP